MDVDGVVKEAFRRGILLVRGATFAADGAPDPHIRFNVAFSQQPRLSQYLQEQLGVAASAQAALDRAARPAHAGGCCPLTAALRPCG